MKKEKRHITKKQSEQLRPTNTYNNISVKLLQYVPLAAIILFVLMVRISLLSIPLERDEGIYAYFGQLILEGNTPYVSFYEMKPPILFYAYAVILAIFGQTVEGLHAGFMCVNILSLVLIFFIGKKLFNQRFASITTVSFGILSMAPQVLGFTAQSEHLVVLVTASAFFLFLTAFERKRPILLTLCGIMVTAGFLIKQTAALFVLFFGLLIVIKFSLSETKNIRELLIQIGAYLSGIILITGLIILSLIIQGAFNEFIFWTISFPNSYVSQISMSQGLKILVGNLKNITAKYVLFWILAAIGLGGSLFLRCTKYKKILLILFAVLSIGTIIPGFRFYPHYWLQLIPMVAIMIGVGIEWLIQIFSDRRFVSEKYKSFITTAVMGIAILVTMNLEHEYYFTPNFIKILWNAYDRNNPFVESKEIADFVSKRTSTDDKIAVFGSEPQIYFYTNRRCPSKHAYFEYCIYNHPKAMDWQREFISDIERTMPKILIFFNNAFSFSGDTNQDAIDSIVEWVELFTMRNYHLVAVADMIHRSLTQYIWKDAEQYNIKSRSFILVWERVDHSG